MSFQSLLFTFETQMKKVCVCVSKMIKSLMGLNNIRLSNDDRLFFCFLFFSQLSIKTEHLLLFLLTTSEKTLVHLKVFWISHVHICSSQRRFTAAVSVLDLLVVHIYDRSLEPYLLRFKSQLAYQPILTHPMFRRHFY